MSGRLDFGEQGRRPVAKVEVAPTLFDAPRPEGWRAPTLGERVCAVCRGAACYGLGVTYWCVACVPAGFLPGSRAA